MRNLVDRMFQEILQSYISHEKRLTKELKSESDIIEVSNAKSRITGLTRNSSPKLQRLERFIRYNSSQTSLDSVIPIGKMNQVLGKLGGDKGAQLVVWRSSEI